VTLHLLTMMVSPLTILGLLIAAPLVLIVLAFKRMRGAVEEPTPIAQYVILPPTNLRP
jgi:hypothetical protein